uniref:Secreted protein n=1 Tax=Globodera rostochiensis TaxID=31243 RepID=A0A914IGT9_GLORO
MVFLNVGIFWVHALLRTLPGSGLAMRLSLVAGASVCITVKCVGGELLDQGCVETPIFVEIERKKTSKIEISTQPCAGPVAVGRQTTAGQEPARD